MRIIVDAMGGDNAPHEIVKGAVEAAREFGTELTLVGRRGDIEDCLSNCEQKLPREKYDIADATEVITMEDDPVAATRHKKDSSMSVALKLLAGGFGDACVSAGSTGALLTGATLTVKRIRGIRRAALAPVLPNGEKGVLLIDCGANAECSPEYLLQFAFMGSFYAKTIIGYDNPRVGLLNIGTEETKGTELCRKAFALLEEANKEGRICFIGNIEAGDILSNKADVVVTDGFTGNVLLKSVEGTAIFLMNRIKTVFEKSKKNMLAAAVVKKDFRNLKKMMDVAEIGGTALLGISKPIVKAHGSSDARAFRSAVRQAILCAEANVAEEIEKNIQYMKLSDDEES
ncbi:MAG: phosphate acyltransferase PlsX [Oscillospiraceae bacterium]|nr:phosphate acyltransferase PlsX [Oscillospiraceae bacterium]